VHTALSANCDALHPGYGFLSERAGFAGWSATSWPRAPWQNPPAYRWCRVARRSIRLKKRSASLLTSDIR
jgi:hypothetical protein